MATHPNSAAPGSRIHENAAAQRLRGLAPGARLQSGDVRRIISGVAESLKISPHAVTMALGEHQLSLIEQARQTCERQMTLGL